MSKFQHGSRPVPSYDLIGRDTGDHIWIKWSVKTEVIRVASMHIVETNLPENGVMGNFVCPDFKLTRRQNPPNADDTPISL
jgi:hypothetical protein